MIPSVILDMAGVWHGVCCTDYAAWQVIYGELLLTTLESYRSRQRVKRRVQREKKALSSRARNLGMETINNFAFLFLLSEDRGVETSESEKKWRHTSPDQLYNFTSLSLEFTSYK